MDYKRTQTFVIDFSGPAGKDAFEELFSYHRDPRDGVNVKLSANGNEIRRLEKLLDESDVEEY